MSIGAAARRVEVHFLLMGSADKCLGDRPLAAELSFRGRRMVRDLRLIIRRRCRSAIHFVRFGTSILDMTMPEFVRDQLMCNN